ncbi:MAG: hypothetical protein JZU60_02445 [Ilumatobacteraceae bacterium]|jgi:hypothetical protein|nr:hypothetical protein [Ilumatobacteraceae bacterium]
MSFISPNFTHEKLENASYMDLVDVFEDRMLSWLLEPMGHLLGHPNGEVAAMALAMSYFEGIEIYQSGKDSKDHSKEYFRRGFQRVFLVETEGAHFFDELVNALYVQARCGFAHDGLFRNRVFFISTLGRPILATWPKVNGMFDEKGHLESVVINPTLFCDALRVHFARYVASLRAQTEEEIKRNFLAAIALKWGLDEPDRVIGISEEAFNLLGKI